MLSSIISKPIQKTPTNKRQLPIILLPRKSIGINHHPKLHSIKLNKLCKSNKHNDIEQFQTKIPSRETEQERKLRMYQNLTLNQLKLNKQYLDKLNDLLQSKTDPEYPFKRLHLNEMTYNNNENLTYSKHLLKESNSMKNNLNYKQEYDALTIRLKTKNKLSIDNSNQSLKRLFPQYNNDSIDSYNNSNLNSYSNKPETQMQSYEQLSPRSIRNSSSSSSYMSIKKFYSPNVKEEKDAIEQLYQMIGKYNGKIGLLRNLNKPKIKKRNMNNGNNTEMKDVDVFQYDSHRWNRHLKINAIKQEEHSKMKEMTYKTLKMYELGNEKLTSVVNRLEFNLNESPISNRRVSIKQ